MDHLFTSCAEVRLLHPHLLYTFIFMGLGTGINLLLPLDFVLIYYRNQSITAKLLHCMEIENGFEKKISN